MASLRPGDGTLWLWGQRGTIGRAEDVSYPNGRWAAPGSGIDASAALLEPLSLYVNQLPLRYRAAGVVVIPVETEGTLLEIATAPELFSTLGFPLLDGE